MGPFNQLILSLMAVSFLVFQGLFHAVSPWASSWVSSGFQQLSRKQKIEWNTRTVSTLHALVVGVFCFYILFFDEATNLDPVWGDATLVKMNVAITAGYLLSDLLLILYFWEAIGDKIFILHHLAALSACYYVLGKGVLPYFANFRLLAELSTPCVNQRWFFEVLGYPKSSKANLANGVLMAVTFFLVRIMVMPIYYGRMYFVFGLQAIYRVSLGARIAWILCSFCLDIMNLMWMRKIFRGCFKALHGGRWPKQQTFEKRKME